MSIQDATFSNRLADMLRAFPKVMPGNLEIELLESSAMVDMSVAIATLEHVRRLGVSVAIDDFGTGYSSLSYLKRLPVDWLKLDQGFVADMGNNPDDVAIVQGIIAIGKAFDLSMIAEGVETLEQGALLIAMGCQHGQGYAIAKPMPVLQFETWLSQWQAPEAWKTTASHSA
jgi:EAL domain-containing protein (putative c-di-GMP-specific phosphodiesterase class I)